MIKITIITLICIQIAFIWLALYLAYKKLRSSLSFVSAQVRVNAENLASSRTEFDSKLDILTTHYTSLFKKLQLEISNIRSTQNNIKDSLEFIDNQIKILNETISKTRTIIDGLNENQNVNSKSIKHLSNALDQQILHSIDSTNLLEKQKLIIKQNENILSDHGNTINEALILLKSHTELISKNKSSLSKSNKDLCIQLDTLKLSLKAVNTSTKSHASVINSNQESITSHEESLSALQIKYIELLNYYSQLSESNSLVEKSIEHCETSLKDYSIQLSMLVYTDSLTRSGLTMPKTSYENLDISKLSWLNSTIRRNSHYNSIVFQSKPRLMSANDYKSIEDTWLPVLDLQEINRSGLSYLSDRICSIENRCHGRYATSIQDALIRILVIRSIIKENDLSFLEIGTLYGVNIACAWDIASVHSRDISITAIDPLDGYYENGTLDSATSLPINDTIFWKNIDTVNCPHDKINLIKAKSDEKDTHSKISDSSFNYFLIDGDHSYDGVKNDFENFSKLLEPGGFLLIDDYSTNDWPDVTKYVDKIIRHDKTFQFVASSWRTIVFKKLI